MISKKQEPPSLINYGADPQGMAAASAGFVEAMRMKNYSEHTVEHREKYLSYFIRWCQDRSILRPVEVTRPILERYQRWLYYYRKADGLPLSFYSQTHHLVAVRRFFRWLSLTYRIPANPASELELPRKEQRLPKHVLTHAEVEQILAQVDLKETLGLRDRAIIETLYSTGVRRMECVGLTLYDLDRDRGTLMVRKGKGKKDRVVPIGERAALWIDKYLTDLRPSLVVSPDPGNLFLTLYGDRMTPAILSFMVRGYVNGAQIGKRGSCHLFRHTMATLMLEGGADVRYVQEMLGHAQITTTQIYTQVSIRKLKEIHTATHPSAKMERTQGASGHLEPAVFPPDEELRAALLSTLAAESDEE